MRKLWFIMLIMAAAVLSACGQSTPEGNQPAPVATMTTALKNAEPTTIADQPAEKATSAATLEPVPTIDFMATEMECQVVSMSPTPGPTEESIFPSPTETDWTQGNNVDPVLTITEYSDFQCPYCAVLAQDLKELLKQHPDDIRVVFRHFPLPSHELAIRAAAAADAAGQQGKFWEMHDILFANQQTFAGMSQEQFDEWLVEQAKALELDEDQFVKGLNNEEITANIQAAQDHGINIGIPGTPLILLNGQYYQGPRDVGNLEAILKLFQLEEKMYTACPPMVIQPGKEYLATLATEKGDITIQLFPEQAPRTVNSFVFLAREGWFDGVTFHRVLPGFVAQTGDPSGTGLGGPGYYFADEISALAFDKPGVVGMANSGPNSNGSQFFITLQPVPDLTGQYTVFGEVIEGMDVVGQLAERNPAQQMGLPPGDQVLSVKIIEQ